MIEIVYSQNLFAYIKQVSLIKIKIASRLIKSITLLQVLIILNVLRL